MLNRSNMKIIKHLLFCTILVSLTSIANIAKAEDKKFFQWHSSNIQMLRGYDYEVGAEKRIIGTFEHAHGHRYGDFFMFVDYTWPENGDSTYYTEISPRFSLSKITGNNFSYGIVKDVLFSTTIEKPKNQKPRYLYGGAVDLAIPNFSFFNINVYVRDDLSYSGNTWQVTVVWKRPFHIGNTSWVSEGFADFAGSEAGTRPNQFIVPRLLMDIGKHLNIQENKLWMGMEYSYWHNKFGIEGKIESLPQLQVKWVF